MKKLISVMAVISLLVFSTVCMANVSSDSQVSLGGIMPGCSGDYVIQVYGAPDREVTRHADGMTLTTYYYGSTLQVAIFTHNNIVHHIYSTGNNGFYTPDGLGVGMSVETVYRLYGRDGFSFYHDGVRYIEYGKGAGNALTIGVKNGKVVSINCSLYE